MVSVPMKNLKKASQLGLTIILAGLLVLIVVASLQAATFSLTRITYANQPGPYNDSLNPSISSDGSKIAFDSNVDFFNQGIDNGQTEIWLYDNTTLTITRITTGSTYQTSARPSISADGSKIAFDSDANLITNWPIPSASREIWLYDSGTMTFTRVTTSNISNRDSYFPSISSDGSKVAFYSDADFLNQGIPVDQTEIWLYDTATLTLTRVTNSVPGRNSWDPSLSSDGSKIVFRSDADLLNQGIPQGQFEVWLYDTTTLTLTHITNGTSGRDSGRPSISSDGSTIAFSSNIDFLNQGIPDNQLEIWLYDTTSLTVTRVTTGTINRNSDVPVLSSDGSKIAFYSDADFLNQGILANQYEIWVYDVISQKLARVTIGTTGSSFYPDLSSDGSKVAFHSNADFFNQSILPNQNEIWLAEILPISGLSVTNDSPTLLGLPTTFTATIINGGNVSYIWDFGDGSGGNGANPGHTYTSAGSFTAIVTATNSISIMTATTKVSITQSTFTIYLPAVMKPGI